MERGGDNYREKGKGGKSHGQKADQLLRNMDPMQDPCENFYEYACGGWLKDNIIPEEDFIYSTFSGLKLQLEKDLKTNRLLTFINPDVDPCSDFYEYVCGGWSRTTVIPDDLTSHSLIVEMSEQNTLKVLKAELEEENDHWSNSTDMSRDMYAACMDTDAINAKQEAPLVDFMAMFGGWPMVTPDWNESAFDPFAVLGKLRNVGFEILLLMNVMPDSYNSSINILYLDQPTLGLSARDYYLKPENDKYVQAYRVYMRTSAMLLNTAAIDEAAISKAVDDVIAFETRIAEIDWDTYLAHALPADLKLEPQEKIILKQPEFFKAFNEMLIQGVSAEVKANYVMWRVVQSTAWNLDKRFRDAAFEYNMVVSGVQSPKARWRDCVTVVQSKLGMAVGYIYIKAVFPEAYKAEAEKMISYIRSAFKEIVEELDWMTDPTKKVSQEKVDAIVEHIGYPDYITDPVTLDAEYEGLSVSGDHFDNIIKYSQWSSLLYMTQLRKPVDESK
ncbi:PREDICTED: membrane metallo-endopeptidase-like 1 [Priapulus caudatus]|uniref:Membrane metallo-endopeptidase-like 1 n=1 Tax=Priapulus caudatus TaxID=37621 RepID=A0ABM1DPA2_PRICU|nr:PREDICTED: membrane metallo-endopeptidase-like 1 [Priapulus caudatus]